MCRRQFGSTRACYTPIKEREGVLPQGGLVHLPWPQKGLTFTPWCWHDLQTRSLCCLGGYWNCLEETCSGLNRQTGRSHIVISGTTCYILGSKKIWLLLENTVIFCTYMGICDCVFPKRFLILPDSLYIGKWRDKYVSIKNTALSNLATQKPLNNSNPNPVINHIHCFLSLFVRVQTDYQVTCCFWRVSDLFVMRFDIEVFLIQRVGISL